MPTIDYLDPTLTGDLEYQRRQRTLALDRDLQYDMTMYGGDQKRVQARQLRYIADKNRLNSEFNAADDEVVDPIAAMAKKVSRNSQFGQAVSRFRPDLRFADDEQKQPDKSLPYGSYTGPTGAGWGLPPSGDTTPIGRQNNQDYLSTLAAGQDEWRNRQVTPEWKAWNSTTTRGVRTGRNGESIPYFNALGQEPPKTYGEMPGARLYQRPTWA